ncbi:MULTISPECIES: serine protease [Methylobacterium]|uniref:serine protease n=1 Tax=Methylobacterium TaxID=407 RepID=UPI0008EAAB7D|nr:MULTISPECIES: serine protease [Methylobacterium]MBZ6412318.1 trypsin-like peptidase domain-containing protein [Methylobacterium sp.]MBK3399207.1 trypsin-like peptidase domain-containing protein [Methylobacterium ajmalii]MBK3410525.1 trypsin-like peptidase domain-containing protein [Methylobacterium ajmalii]MBK3424832.1 trypsin-like peptidase domain-containing protein [Methylobacterium ajmalii]SFE71888.1 Putative peptidoglycan binding domain-containing protein [Methylobacterium sp. yr596]
MARHCAHLTVLAVGLALAGPAPALAQAPAGYGEAESRFAFMETERRVRLQTLLTAAGYWTGMPNVTFGRRLFEAIAQFQGENGFRPTGWLDGAQLARLRMLAAPNLSQWGLRTIAHPFRPVSIWAPMGLGLTAERTARGLDLKDPTRRLTLAYNALPNVAVADAFGYTVEKFQREGATLHYKVLRSDFFAISASQNGTDIYMRYHQDGPGALGFVLRWDTRATDLSAERIAVLLSASLWSAMTPDAPFIPLPEATAPDARTVTLPPVLAPPPAAQAPSAVAAVPPASPSAAKPRESSGTGFFVGIGGEVLTNSHVVEECGQVEVRGAVGTVPARLVARDAANDLAILRTTLTPPKVAGLRLGIRLGEPVAAFGYPLAGMLSTSGNFTLGNVTALTGLGDNTSYLQVSAPVQPGNSGGPLLDGNGNLVGVVTAKLNALKVMVATNGDIPQNVNFALKGAVAATFLESNGVAFTAGTTATAMAPADLADHAKAMSVFVTCR